MSKLHDSAISQSKEGGWDIQCPVTDGTCGAGGVGFRSTGWPSKKVAVARAEQHFAEHRWAEKVAAGEVEDGEEPPRAQTLEDFRAAHGLTVDPETGVVSFKDLA
jgi:hypothetical protein